MSTFEAPLISIIIPCYKAEKELPEALASISSQTYSPWEVVAVIDGWEDRSEEILKSFKSNHPRNQVTIIKHSQNQGLAAARNTGFIASRGQFIALLDHDDMWTDNHLETALRLIENKKADLYFTPVMYMKANGDPTNFIWGPTPQDLENFADSLFGRNFMAPSGVVFSRKLFNLVGLMDKTLKRCEDHDYWLRSYLAGLVFCHSSTSTAKYRVNNSQAMTSNVASMLKTDIRVQKKHYSSPSFSNRANRSAIANNYSLLAKDLKLKKPLEAYYYSLLAIFWNPSETRHIKTLIKNLLLEPWAHKN
jgi:glycosyltransferase involved in cell wall biosynthesis